MRQEFGIGCGVKLNKQWFTISETMPNQSLNKKLIILITEEIVTESIFFLKVDFFKEFSANN